MKSLPTPLLVFGAMLSASLAFRCAAKSDPAEGNSSGGSSTQGGGTGGVGTGGVISTGGSGGSQGRSCTGMLECPLPPSVCQDGLHLIYYTTPACVAGQCTYTEEIFTCTSFCASGACGASTTTTMTMPPPPDPRCLGGMGGAGGTTESGSGGVNGGAGAGGEMGARIIAGSSGFGAGGQVATGGSGGAGDPIGTGGISGAGGMSGGTGGMSGAGAMGSTSCELPPSVCADDTTLIYYTNPYCDVWLQCMYMSNTLDCMGPCTNGACQGGFTAPAPP